MDGVGETALIVRDTQAVAVNPSSGDPRELSGVTGSVTLPQASDLIGVPNIRTETIVGDARALHFRSGDVLFKPFYEAYGRHSVYLDVTLK